MGEYFGFELISEQSIPELDIRGRLFRHSKTGAELLSLENDDENKVFGISFRTPPADSTGLPHIMEHSVLCGSRKYPVKEPFVELVKGSLKTFLNAFTYPDKTCYPVASQNLQDFYNLIDVYLDAVFYPLIPPQTLDQEGWHYELEAPQALMAFKGVVYNEMKGAYSSPERLISKYSQHSLFPDNTYGLDSGGDPERIPDLTYDQFKEFHDTYYHPSNARIFLYGDDDPQERLRRMDEYLKDFVPLAVESQVPLQPAFEQPRRLEFPYEAGEDGNGKKGMVTVNWLLPDTCDPETTLALHILSYILVSTPASPLRKALIDSGLGEDLVGGGLEGELRQMFFSSGLKGIAVEDAGKVEELILQTLNELAENGIDPDMVAAAVNTTEFRLRENNSGSFPRGLSLMLRALTTWLHGGDPFSPLAFEAPLFAIKERLETGQLYFESLIDKHLLQNTHRTVVLLKPDSALRQRIEAVEQERLAKARASMDQNDLLQLVEKTRLLKERQERPDSPEALATIPSLKLSDLEEHNKTIPLMVLEFGGRLVFFHDLFTNGILYLDVGMNLHFLPDSYLPYVPLFGRALLEMGTESQDFVKLSQRIGSTTGGIWPASFTSTIRQQDESAAWLFLRGKATAANAGHLLEILREILLTPKLDNRDRFRQIVLEEKATLEAQLIPMGHRIVNLRLRAQFNEADWASEQMGGVNYLLFLRELAARIDSEWPAVLNNLETVRSLLVNGSQMLFNVTLGEENWETIRPELDSFIQSLPVEPNEIALWNYKTLSREEGLAIPGRGNYVGKGANLYQLGYEYNGSVSVITAYLRNTFLWDRIRVQGGAYGAFCVFDHRSGVLTFLSYRDPNLETTLENYDQAYKYLRQLEINSEELTKNIIGAIGEMDAYQLPDAKGYTSMLRYLAGDTDEFRQLTREQILGTTLADFHAFSRVLERVREEGLVAVLGPQEAIEAVNRSSIQKLELLKVL